MIEILCVVCPGAAFLILWLPLLFDGEAMHEAETRR